MFERYTEKARRVIFFARDEVSRYGSSRIQSEHLLLGLLKVDENLIRSLPSDSSIEEIRKELEHNIETGKPLPTSVGVPFSPECELIAAFALEEINQLNHDRVETDHLLLGILHGGSPASQILQKHGLEYSAVRERVVNRTWRT